jgi:adenylate cyclase
MRESDRKDPVAWRLLAAGLPLLRASFHARILHPQFLGTNLVWSRTVGQTVQTMIAHALEEVLRPYNTVRRVRLTGETLQRRLDLPDDKLDFPILHELKAAGGTDYLALPTRSALGANYVLNFVTSGRICRGGNRRYGLDFAACAHLCRPP